MMGNVEAILSDEVEHRCALLNPVLRISSERPALKHRSWVWLETNEVPGSSFAYSGPVQVIRDADLSATDLCILALPLQTERDARDHRHMLQAPGDHIPWLQAVQCNLTRLALSGLRALEAVELIPQDKADKDEGPSVPQTRNERPISLLHHLRGSLIKEGTAVKKGNERFEARCRFRRPLGHDKLPAKDKGNDVQIAAWGLVTEATSLVLPDASFLVRYHDLGGNAAAAPTPVKEFMAKEHVEPNTAKQLEAVIGRAWCERTQAVGGGFSSLLLHGTQGTGKTRLLKLLAMVTQSRLVMVAPGKLLASAGVNADRALQRAGDYCHACCAERVLLVIDYIDKLVPRVDGAIAASASDTDAGLVTCLTALLKRKGRALLVAGICSEVAVVHPIVRKCFEDEVELRLPQPGVRRALLERGLQAAGFSLEAEAAECARVAAAATAGFSCAGVKTLLAACLALHSQQGLSLLDAMKKSLTLAKPAVLISRGGLLGAVEQHGIPNIPWSSVIGHTQAKQAIQEMVVWPSTNPEAYKRIGITPASGILLHGPPGTGKTLLAKAAASETGARFLELKISQIVRCEVGESEKAVMNAFAVARELRPSVIFIDEFQALFTKRGGGMGGRLASQLVTSLDDLERWKKAGMKGTVTVLAATNALEAIDKAFLRSGRLDEVLLVALPSLEDRCAHLKMLLGQQRGKLRWEPLDIAGLAAATEGFSGAGIANMVKDASVAAVEEWLQQGGIGDVVGRQCHFPIPSSA
ncbi:unnamed protein product [Chrysoparadoxa australica]